MRWFYAILLLPLFLSCGKNTCDQDYIRSLAIENMVDDFYPINWLLRYYARAYYTLPTDFDEFLSFVKDCKENDPFFSEVEKVGNYDILETISNSKIRYASFCDSAFFYIPDYNVGSRVIGTPRFWIESPNSYPELASRYETIPPSAFDSSGKFIFTLDYTSLEFFINHLSESQGKQVFYQDRTTGETIPLKAVYVYDNRNDSLVISSTIPSNEYLSTRNTSGKDEYRPVSSNYTVDHYLHGILAEITAYFTDKPKVSTVYFVANVFVE